MLHAYSILTIFHKIVSQNFLSNIILCSHIWIRQAWECFLGRNGLNKWVVKSVCCEEAGFMACEHSLQVREMLGIDSQGAEV
jgi:hypothetical protein